MNTDRFKFRVWDKKEEEYIKPTRFNISGDGRVVIYSRDYEDWNEDDDDYIVEQCTGLRDKSGKLIYQSDIIKSPSGAIGTVVWTCGNFAGGWMVKCKGKEPPRLFDSTWEIVGNIHGVKE